MMNIIPTPVIPPAKHKSHNNFTAVAEGKFILNIPGCLTINSAPFLVNNQYVPKIQIIKTDTNQAITYGFPSSGLK